MITGRTCLFIKLKMIIFYFLSNKVQRWEISTVLFKIIQIQLFLLFVDGFRLISNLDPDPDKFYFKMFSFFICITDPDTGLFLACGSMKVQCFGSIFIESRSGSGSSQKSQSGSRKALNPDPDPSYFFTLSEKKVFIIKRSQLKDRML